MLIGICDDEVVIRKELIKLCEKYKEINFSDIEIIGFSSGDALLESKETIDILFLDIQMKGLDGMQTAEKIREYDDGMTIIFLTGYTGYMQAGYRVRAFRYLLKPVKEKEFMDTLIEAIQDIKKNSKAIVGMEGDIHFIKLKDIIYVEYVDRYTVVRTRRGTYESQTSMNEWESILDNGDFFRVHKAYIVNMAYIDDIDKEILLDNGEKVELSIRMAGKLKKACRVFRRRSAK
jgi:DNA-binding LytR/AlgR family response regulator